MNALNMRTLLIQSWRQESPTGWLGECMSSVRHWAQVQGHDYRFVGDSLFDDVPLDIGNKFSQSPVVLSDLARLIAMRQGLQQGYERVIWLDADSLILQADWEPACESFLVGREVWVQKQQIEPTESTSAYRSFVKVHNAFLCCSQGNSFLDFYIDTATRLLREFTGENIVPQFIGPKLLTALHNVVGFPVAEGAAMLPPQVLLDLLEVDESRGKALAIFRQRSKQMPAIVNLCASSIRSGEVSEQQMNAVIKLLQHSPERLR